MGDMLVLMAGVRVAVGYVAVLMVVRVRCVMGVGGYHDSYLLNVKYVVALVDSVIQHLVLRRLPAVRRRGGGGARRDRRARR